MFDLIAKARGDVLELTYGAPITVVSAALRGLFIASEGNEFIGADYSSIEARVLAWLAGEEAALDIFRSHGKVYEDFAAKIFGVLMEDVTKDQRAHGKVGVLGCGYQMGWKTLMAYAEGMGIILTEQEAKDIVYGYRDLNPFTVRWWKALNNAAIRAVSKPGSIQTAGRVSFQMKGWFLRMRLPTGRDLFYASPMKTARPLPWDPEKMQTVVQIWHVNSKTRQWSPRTLYGGLLAENATQAVARDVMVDGMFALEAAPHYTPVLTVHDEVVSEVPIGEGSVAEAAELMTTLGPWAEGLPIKAAGWRGRRFRKD
jgi:DNA polymerase